MINANNSLKLYPGFNKKNDCLVVVVTCKNYFWPLTPQKGPTFFHGKRQVKA
jgi:hypothetical protein